MSANLVADGLYVIPVGQVNTFLLDAPDGCTLIDAGYPGKADTILGAVRELGKQPSDIRHIVVTHAHPDHIGSLAAIKQATGAEAYIHPLDASIATEGTGFCPLTPAPGRLKGILFRIFIRPVDAVEATTIEHRVEDGETLPMAGGPTAIHVPGHCAGRMAFLWPRHGGVLFAADACGNSMGLSLSLGYEDVEEGKRSLSKLAPLDFNMACFGHGKAIMHDASAQFQKKWA